MEAYKTRKIKFKELIEIGDWKIKVYTISKIGEFQHPIFYKNVLNQLPNWLQLDNSFDASNNKIGFLILHAGTEGIFSLINWWVGRNMLNTHIFFTKPDQPNTFKKISGDGLVSCVWEMEIINHERISWLNNVLKKEVPDYKNYLKDIINTEI